MTLLLPIDLTTLPDGLNPLELFMENFNYLLNQIAAQQTILGDLTVVTTPGPFVISPGQIGLALNKAIPSATAISLPTVASRLGLPVRIVDWAGNAGDLTITPHAGETIMGLASAIVGSNGQGLGTAGSLMLWPSVNLSGWYTAP